MAKRFGGKYSPDTPEATSDRQGAAPLSRFRGRRAERVSLSARLMFLAPLPLLAAGLFSIMGGNPLEALVEISGFALLTLGAWLLNEGIKAEEAYNNRKIARPPGFPRKLAAAVLAASGVFIVQTFGLGSLLSGLVFSAMAAAAHVFAFGLDPLKSKGMDGVDTFATERVANAIETAEAHVADILSAARRIGDRGIEARVEAMVTHARDVFRTVEDDPRDLPRARKFLGVYLQGARDATVKFADLYNRNRDEEAKADYTALLADLETSFAKHREDLLKDNRTDLDVEIEVLRERLQQEGLKA